MKTPSYPRFLSTEQISTIRARFSSGYKLSQAAGTNGYYTELHLRRERKVLRHSVERYAKALGMGVKKFESLDLTTL